ncbi:MAG: hypothetical protein J6B77_08045 [Clostridia bacterium]|nr:hypothetical protein [Clostridia bacterium]
MKKATLLTFLFAVLMIALLVSCNTSPDPLPDETSSEITTDAVTTEEITTEEATTAEETLDLDPDWVNDTTPAPYRYLEGLPNDKWYFDWTPTPSGEYGMNNLTHFRYLFPYIEESVLYVIQTPRRYETEKDGLLFRFEFFEEEYLSRSLMQIRITLINVSRDQVTIYDSPLCDTYIVKQNDLYRSIANLVFDWEEQELWGSTGNGGSLKPFILSYGDSYTFERVMAVEHDPLSLQRWKYLAFTLNRADRFGDGLPGRSVTVQVPIEFVEYESVAP